MMAPQTDETRVVHASPTDALPVLRSEAARCTPHMASPASSGGELPRGGAAAAHPPIPATNLYASGLSWPVLTKGANIYLLCGQRVDIVSMPSGLAGDVNNSLRLLWLDAAVLEIEGTSRRWAFFCQSPSTITNLGALEHHGVAHYGTNALFQLPSSPFCNSESLSWICPPIAGVSVLPSIGAVISCAQTALRRWSGSDCTGGSRGRRHDL